MASNVTSSPPWSFLAFFSSVFLAPSLPSSVPVPVAESPKSSFLRRLVGVFLGGGDLARAHSLPFLDSFSLSLV